MDELEITFGLSVNAFHEGLIDTKDACLCKVDVESYLDAVRATWYKQDTTADDSDLTVLMMPANYVSVVLSSL
ncbi:hypothetical protein GCM10027423_18800 [Spirosoma arcticum]